MGRRRPYASPPGDRPPLTLMLSELGACHRSATTLASPTLFFPSTNNTRPCRKPIRRGRTNLIMDVEESPWADSNQAASQGDAPPATGTSSNTAQTGSISSPSAARPSRGPRRLVAQPTRLEAVEDPLGPLSASNDDDAGAAEARPPAPPQKEQLVMRTTMPPQQAQSRRPADPHRIDDDDDDDDLNAGSRGPRVPPPVDAALPSSNQSGQRPSVSVEQASKPTFHISVGDPVKIGDLTSSHIVYSVRTKVCSSGSRHDEEPSMTNTCSTRLLPAPISNPNSRSSVGIETSSGYTTPCTETIPATWCLRLPISRPSVALTVTLSRPDARLWRRC